MKVEILAEASEDLICGYHFYEEQSPGLGSYFLDSLFSDIDSLLLYAGIHRVVFGWHRCLSKRFPFATTIAWIQVLFVSALFLIVEGIRVRFRNVCSVPKLLRYANNGTNIACRNAFLR